MIKQLREHLDMKCVLRKWYERKFICCNIYNPMCTHTFIVWLL